MHHNFKELNIWRESKDLCLMIYKRTPNFPKSEVYTLTNQMNRAVISIVSNIAEGAGRNSNKDFSRFIQMALRSSFELETQLIISKELSFINQSDFDESILRLNKILKRFVNFNKHLQSN